MPTRDEPLLLTPGPLTTSYETKAAMVRDWGSRDTEFIALNARVRQRLVALAGGEGTHVCVPVQGSGTFAIEATVGTLLPRDGKMLVLVNGAYGQRIARICEIMGRACATIETPEDVPNDPAALDSALAADGSITHVAVIHCETTSGMLNPLAEVAAVTRALSTTVQMLVSQPPNEVRAAMAATETRAAIRPYSMAVAPDSSLTNLTKIRFSMLISKRLCAWMFVAS